MLRQKMVVGPKGQVVIPKDIRAAEQIYPGTEVIFETTDHGIHIEKAAPKEDLLESFRGLAKKINFRGKINSDKDYEEMLEGRWKKLKKHT
ncbi:MAG TPA: AbrB/MazE/SpoVT family DNA-binding domain-containing protein [archaeon]|nr:AbrB/MazE/SpoVT family DNA-binding domain-containing protein [archaeon]